MVLSVLPLAPAQAAAPQGRDVSTAIEARLRSGHVPGAFATVVNGEVTTGTHGYGVTAETPFVIGSLSKSFTAVAVLQLVQHGRVDLDAPVTRYISWYSSADAQAVPTVRQLLDQTSGLPTEAGVKDLTHTGRTLQERVRSIASVTPTSSPGERFQYCNLNYAVLGLMVEQVSGQPFADYLQQHVLTPLRMDHTYTSLDQARAAGLEPATVPLFGVAVRQQTAAFPGALPDGYLVSSAADMANFLQMLLNDGSFEGRSVLSPHLVAAMQTTATSTPDGAVSTGADGYGLGLATGTTGSGERMITHPGDLTGYHSDLGLLPDRDEGLVVLTAQNNVLLQNDAAFQAGLAALADEPQTASSWWSGYVGRYTVIDGAAAGLVVLMLLRARRLMGGRARSCRRRGAGWALVGLAGSTLVSGVLYGVVTIGGGYAVQGYPLDLSLVVANAPEVAALAGLLIGWPVLSSVLRSVGARRGHHLVPHRHDHGRPEEDRGLDRSLRLEGF